MGKRSQILTIFTLLFGTIAIGVISYQIVLGAGYKLFWRDEANEIFNSCADSYSHLLIQGASTQCSSAPLYYIFQKFVVSHVPLSGENILYLFRAPSIVSASLSLVFLFFGFTKYLGLPWGLAALILMTDQPKFHQFGAENRPYMLWVFFFSATLMIVSSLIYKPRNQMSAGAKILLGLLALALTLVTSVGMIQAVGFLAAFLVWEESLKVHRWIKHPAFKFLLLLTALSCTMGIYYALKGCLQFQHNAGEWDVVTTTNRSSLAEPVVSLLWPLQGGTCHDYLDPCGLVTWVTNFFVLVGMAAPFWLWNDRKNLSEEKKFLLSVSMVSILQILAAAAIGVLVAWVHYYFIQRVFIYLIVLRAALAVCGGYLCLSWLLEKWTKSSRNLNRRPLFEASLVALLAVGLSGFLYIKQRSLEYSEMREARSKWPALTQATCPPTKGSLALVNAKAASVRLRLNFIVVFGEQLKTCGWVAEDGPTSYVLPKFSPDGKTYGYEITEKLPAGSSILGFFHRPLSFEP